MTNARSAGVVALTVTLALAAVGFSKPSWATPATQPDGYRVSVHCRKLDPTELYVRWTFYNDLGEYQIKAGGCRKGTMFVPNDLTVPATEVQFEVGTQTGVVVCESGRQPLPARYTCGDLTTTAH